VVRVYYVRAVDAPGVGTLYIASAFSDLPRIEAASEQPCNWRYDQLCSLAYTRRVLGTVVTAMLRAASIAELREVFARATWREYNQQATSSDAGFYPFIYNFGGRNVAHGAVPTLLDRNLPAIISGSATLSSLVNGTELNGFFVSAARVGGGWTGYYWRNSLTEAPYLKIAYIAGLTRFGDSYYVGVGFNHQMPPAALGPHCAECRQVRHTQRPHRRSPAHVSGPTRSVRAISLAISCAWQDFNYPCAWANAGMLVSHVQSLTFMANRHTIDEAAEHRYNQQELACTPRALREPCHIRRALREPL
jgi:hypothetical protein